MLVAHRQAHLHQGGLLEFPGGKVDPGEDALAALCRELLEELDIRVEAATPLIDVDHAYPDKHVLLEVWTVSGFSGTPRGMQGQPLVWMDVRDLDPARFPAANAAIIHRLHGGGDAPRER